MKTMKNTLILLLSAAAMTCTTGCMPAVSVFDHDNQYTAGDFSTGSTIKTLDIDWTSGSVTVSHHDQSDVTVTEHCNVALKDAQKVQTWLEGSTLHVRYCKSGMNFNLFNAEKKLEVRLPKGMELDTLKCDCTSAETSLSDICAGRFDVDVTSGKVQLSGCSADCFDIGSVSGDIIVEQKGKSDTLNAQSTSGKTNITAETVRELKAYSTSGDTSISAQQSDSVFAHSTSGIETFRLHVMPAVMNVETSSGNVSLFVPKASDFCASVETVSGTFDSDISLSKNGGVYTAGSGSNQLQINTTSGDIAIKAEE